MGSHSAARASTPSFSPHFLRLITRPIVNKIVNILQLLRFISFCVEITNQFALAGEIVCRARRARVLAALFHRPDEQSKCQRMAKRCYSDDAIQVL